MLSDPGSIQKVEGALTKLADCNEKLCVVRLAETTEPNDKTMVIAGIDAIAIASHKLSLIIPGIPE